MIARINGDQPIGSITVMNLTPLENMGVLVMEEALIGNLSKTMLVLLIESNSCCAQDSLRLHAYAKILFLRWCNVYNAPKPLKSLSRRLKGIMISSVLQTVHNSPKDSIK